MHKNKLVSAVSAALILGSFPVIGQSPGARTLALEEVVVTAQRRAELLQHVPISIASLSADQLRENNVMQLSDIGQLTPAVRFDYNANFVQPTIRGIGTSVVTAGGSSNVGIYVDGFYSPNPLSADMELLSLESIQVLKGPQGTLFGRNTTGGAILISTGEPSVEPRAIVEGTYGRFNTGTLQAYATGGLTDRLAVDLGASVRTSDGYVDNIIDTGPDDPGSYDNWSVRAGLKFAISDNASLLFRYTHHDVDDGTNLALGSLVQDGQSWAAGSGAPLWPFPSDNIASDFRDVSISGDWPTPNFALETDIYQLTGTFDLGFADLTSYTQYREEDSATLFDEDETANPVLYAKIFVRDETFSQEFLLTSNADGPLQWTAGLFYFDYKDTYEPVDFSIFGGPFFRIAGSSGTTNSLAAYLDLTYELIDSLYLTVGGRYSRDEYGDAWSDVIDFNTFVLTRVFPDDIDDTKFTPRVVLRYEISDSSSVYASYTQGYKAGIIDLPRPGGPGEVEPEEVDAYEIGYKRAAGNLSYSLAGWYYDYKDLQVSTYPQGLAFVNNAASAEIYGVEAALQYQVTADFDINLGAAWVSAEYEQFPDASRYAICADAFACGTSYGLLVPYGFDASGLDLQRSPDITANLGARYGFDLFGGRTTLSANLYYSSKFYFDLAEQYYQDSYQTLGLRAEWVDPTESYTVAVFGENVTDEEYYKQITINNYGAGTVWGTPASCGVSIRVAF